jgi:hypothetical protein
MKKDLRLTRICIASIRWFYPDIRIDLIKDESKGLFSTKDLEKNWNCGLETFGRKKIGGSGMLTKLEPLSLKSDEQVLLLDCDTVFAGRALDRLENTNADFIVAEDTAHGDLTTSYGSEIVKSFLFNLDALREIEPSYRFPHKMFNAGHIIIRISAIPKELVRRFVSGPPPFYVYTNVFQMGDQGFWNFLLQWLHQSNRASLEYIPFATYPRSLPEYVNFRERDIQNLPNVIFHWAGQHNKSRLRHMPQHALLYFFEAFYYSKIRFGWFKRLSAAFFFWARYWTAACRRFLIRITRRCFL